MTVASPASVWVIGRIPVYTPTLPPGRQKALASLLSKTTNSHWAIGQILVGHRGDAFAHPLDHRIDGRVVIDGGLLFKLVEAGQPELHLLTFRNQVQLFAAGHRHGRAALKENQPCHTQGEQRAKPHQMDSHKNNLSSL